MSAASGRELLGIRVGGRSIESLVDDAMSAVSGKGGRFVFACANPHSLVVAKSDSTFREALHACSAVVADGVGVTMVGRLAGIDVGPRITGTDFFLGTMRALNRRGGRVFFLGSTEGVLKLVTARAASEFPNVHVETFSPPFGTWTDEINDAIVQQIRDARPDFLWLGMTAPKQEKWAYANREKCGVPVVGSIGAVFDFYAQTVRRAPDWMCRCGIEWVYRLAHEPRRLWRRTVVSAPTFLWYVLQERLHVR